MATSEGFGRGRGGYGGGRGAYNQGAEAEQSSGATSAFPGRGAFQLSSITRGGGGYGGGRGAYNQSSEETGSGNSRGGFSTRGRGGTSNQESESGQSSRGAFRGRGGAYNQDTESNQNSRGGGFAFRGRGGNYNQESEDGQNSRGGFGAGRGRGFNQGSEEGQSSRGAFRGRGGNYNQESEDGQNSRGGFGAGSGRGNFNQNSEDGQSSRGAFRGRGGNENQESNGGRGGFSARGRGFHQGSEDAQNSRGGFSGGRGRGGNDNQESEGGRGGFGGRGRGFNQGSEDGQNSRGGFGGGRGRGNFNQERNNEDQENHFGNGRGGFTQSRTGADAPAAGLEGEVPPPQRAPYNFVPKSRDLEAIYKEDEDSAAAYTEVVDNDDDVIVENSKCEVVRIQNWEEADFDPKLLENIKQRSKYSRPRKIQGATIPFILDHFDVKAQAETGSGKTAAFVLPILDSCIKAKKSQNEDRFVSELAAPYAVIVGPTRELVLQVFEQALKFANGTGVTVAKAYGQYNINRNHEEIREGCDILIATVGRLKQFVLNEDIFVHKIRYFVLDEADRLLDQGFIADIKAITSAPLFPSKENRVNMLFSATFDSSVMEIADQMLKPDAVWITNQHNSPNKKIKQDFVVLDGKKPRLDVLRDLLKEEVEKAGGVEKMRRTLVFVNTKRTSDMAALYLCQHDIPASSINGDRGQDLREEAIRDFRSHKVSVLISTDVTARGIDVKELDHVINYDLPQDGITYIHRIGRTGRIGVGYATTFIDGSEEILNDIANMLRSMGTLPETLEKVLNGDAPSKFAPSAAPLPQSGFAPAAVPSNFAPAAAPPSNFAPAPAAPSSFVPAAAAAPQNFSGNNVQSQLEATIVNEDWD